MDQIQCMRVFVRVAQRIGFAAAARDLGISKAAVSKHVGALESRIGTRLLDRTTRRVALTEAGRLYLERCLECLQSFEDADASMGELSKEPRGSVRVSAPVDFGDPLLPVLARVMSANPGLRVDLRLSNRVIDMVEEGVDVSVRVAHALDGAYVARPIARVGLAVYGSPAYFRRHGRPRRPEELASHRTVVFAEPRPLQELLFSRGDEAVRVKLDPVMVSNDGGALRAAIEEGIGLGAAPSFLIKSAAQAGRVEPILPRWTLPEYRAFVVYPHRRFLSPKVRVIVEALRERFGDGSTDPWWPERAEA